MSEPTPRIDAEAVLPFQVRTLDLRGRMVRLGPALETLRAMAAGCDDYDTKPVDLPRLLSKISALLGEAPQ